MASSKWLEGGLLRAGKAAEEDFARNVRGRVTLVPTACRFSRLCVPSQSPRPVSLIVLSESIWPESVTVPTATAGIKTTSGTDALALQ